MATLPNAQKILARLRESIPYESTTSEFVEEIEGLDKELEECYNVLRQLQNRPISEILHGISRLVEACCCAYWKARVRDAGDFCPDCVMHKGSVGLKEGELRVVRGPRSRLFK